jgi:hypothetical protein
MESLGFQALAHSLHYFAILPRLCGASHDPEVIWLPATASDVTAQLGEYFRSRHEFVDDPAESGDDLVTLEGNTVTAAVRYRHGDKVMVSAPWYYSLLRTLLPALPRLNQPIRAWGLSHLSYTDSVALSRLLRGVAAQAVREKVSLLLLPVFANDPRRDDIHTNTLSRWGVPATRARLYVRGESSNELLQRVDPLLASARDG